MTKNVKKTLDFLNAQFEKSEYMNAHPTDREYRLAHTMRVANIGRRIAKAEKFDEELMTIGCLLHDVSYANEFDRNDGWLNHGREAAKMARPFLETLDISAAGVEQICYGIAIHVDDEAGFHGERTAFALSIGDADNVDRFDAYRLYEQLLRADLKNLKLAEQTEYVKKAVEKLSKYARMEMATATATNLFRDRVNFQLQFYRKLAAQFSASTLS